MKLLRQNYNKGFQDVSRPYFNYSGQQLRDLFEGASGDELLLKELRDELEHRNTPKMAALRAKVEDALGAKKSTSHDESGTAKQAKASQPTSMRKPIGSSTAKEPSPPEEEQGDSVLPGPVKGQLGVIRACGRLADVPSRWNFPERRDVKLDIPADATRLVRYGIALRALIREMKKKGSGLRTVTLEGGQAITLDGRDRAYTFAYDGDAELFEGAKIQLVTGSRHVDGRIVSVSSVALTLSVEEDLGPSIATCVLKIDNTAMLEALADRLEKHSKGEENFHLAMADDVICNAGDEKEGHVPTQVDLNEKQARAVGSILGNAVTYLWGPPGTGKTKSLSVANQLLFEAGKRILICSNTNQAVDQVLLKLCETLGKNHPAMEEGKILRLGQIHHAELKNDWAHWITLDGIVGRKSEGLKARKEKLESDIERIRQSVENAMRIVDSFKRLETADREYSELSGRQATLEKALRDSTAMTQGARSKLAELQQELRDRESAGFMRRIVLRSGEQIAADIKKTHAVINDATQRALEQRSALDSNAWGARLEELRATREHLRCDLSGVSRETAQKDIDDADDKIRPLHQEVAEINRKLEAIEKTIVNEAKIVGATVTKTYLSPQLFTDFDVVIVDEASMVMLPAIYYVSGLAKEKVVISGDFRQLSPIVPSDQAPITEEIGANVFCAAGIEDAFNRRGNLKRTVMLEQQYRMKSGICDLISPRMYDHRLKTAPGLILESVSLPPPFDAEMVIVDTSPIQPFVNRHGTSRYNLMHALSIRNVCRYLGESGFINSRKRLGICTPFAAQREVLTRVLDAWDLGELIEVGTVHRYQGDEKTSMIIDIPDSLGERYVGMFAQAEHPDEDGAKLFNVAVSRAKEQVIFVANLDYLDRKLPSQAFLRDILHSVQSRGRIVDVRDVLAMWPIQDDLRNLGRPISLDPETLRSGLFRQTDFDAVCNADIEAAKKSVAIFSGFVTPQRVATYEPLFRRKQAEGVVIRCVTRPPKRNGSIPEDMGRDALDGLEAIGCIVDTRWDIHEKVVIIDDEIVWFGSLNPLSHTNRTDEMMARFSARPAALQLAAFMALGTNSNPDKAAGLSVTKENPRCQDCGRRSVYRTGSHGPFWQCENECGWTESFSRPKRNKSSPASILQKDGPACPTCGSATALRQGPYGEFYGCTKYPACNGVIQIKNGKAIKKAVKKD